MSLINSARVRSAMVIGGGISGPVTAAALHRAGIDTRVYEAYPGPAHSIGSNLALAPNGLAALDVIGVGDAIRAVAAPFSAQAAAIGAKHVDLPRLDGVEPLRLVDRPDLHRVLHEHAVAQGVVIEYGRRLVGVDERADGVTARFADGSTATADVLIGADGIHSATRALVDPQAPGPTYLRMLGFGAYTTCDLELPPESMTFAFGRRAYYLYGSMPDGRVMWGANLPHERKLSLTEARAIPAERWLEILRETYAQDDPGAELVRRTRPEDLEVVGGLYIMPRVPNWWRGRMALTGDAVHAPSNSSGQGASLAIESGIELARCLRDIGDPAAAFAAYEALRRPRVEAVAARVARTNSTKAAGPVARRMMSALMPVMFRMMNPEKVFGAEQRFRIDWDAPVRPERLGV
ncbi:FAD-dependent oxidoreductase [Nocardia sp. NPDC003693]